MEKIICDADLDYLGRDDFFEISDTLRLELKENNKVQSDRQWDEIQVKFLTMHRYFTTSSIQLRREKKMKHLKIIKEVFGSTWHNKITVLDIKDIYKYGSNELIEILQERIQL